MFKKIFKKIEGEFTGEIFLKSWQECFDMDLPIEIIIGGEEDIEEIKKYHIATFEYICENQADVMKSILESIFDNYETWQVEYGYNDASFEEKEYSMPDIDNVANLLPLITPKRVIILDVEKDGYAYYGVQFVCSWDQEHNLGAMLYKTRVVAIGGDDTAFLSWIAEEDLESFQ